MAKELPYFRFTPQEWQNGDISLERYELRGLFIDICSYYWVKDCSITLAMLEKRYSNDVVLLNELFELDIISKCEDLEYAVISFLDEQFDVLSEARKRRQEAGRKGGKQKSSNAKAKPKQSSSYKDKYKYKDNIEKRQSEFKDEVRTFNDIYERDILQAFFNYWSEPTQRKDKMRYELEKTWDTKRRLSTWFNRSQK
jgi:hypothetical protein